MRPPTSPITRLAHRRTALGTLVECKHSPSLVAYGFLAPWSPDTLCYPLNVFGYGSCRAMKTRPRGEKIVMLRAAISHHPHFVMSGSMFSLRKEFADCFEHERWIGELPCPVLRLDGTNLVSENAEYIVSQYRELMASE